MFIIDQHAAHEKILYEETVKRLKNEDIILQNLNPPIILSLSLTEEALLNKYSAEFKSFGFEIEHFGGREYAVRAVPYQFVSVDSNELLKDILDNLSQDTHSFNSELITDKIASISCKAAVKGNSALSFNEADEMIDRLLSLDNPYQCPHGRPTIISISKYEMEKKFKRVL